MSSPIGGACKPVEIVASWHLCAFALVQLRFSGRLVRPTLRGAFLGLEIGTSQSTLPVVAGRFGRTPHIALSGAFWALRASDCNGWPRRWVSGGRRDWDPGRTCRIPAQDQSLRAPEPVEMADRKSTRL